MELVEGETLEARVRRDGPLDVGTILEMGRQVCAALVAAAARGLIHRDLKPSNLMLHRGDAGLEVKVIDFGLAKAVVASELLRVITRQAMGPPYGELRCSPYWDDLRRDPRFALFLATLAPR